MAAPRHPMVTRGRAGIHKPNPKYAMAASQEPISPIPKSVRSTVKDPNWYAAMKLEFDALQANRTWTLVPRPPGARIITGKWVFKHKLNPDGELERYKAVGRPWVQSAARRGLRRDLLAGHQAGDDPHRLDARSDLWLACSQIGCFQCVLTWQFTGTCVQSATHQLHRLAPPGRRLPAVAVTLWPAAGSPGVVRALRRSCDLARLHPVQGGFVAVRATAERGHCLPSAVRGRHDSLRVFGKPPPARHRAPP